MSFVTDDLMLSSPAGRRLYHEFAKNEPILDYHNHLPPEDIAIDRQFSNLFEIWLEGDHYKWRAMRLNGTAEEFCTGNAAPYDKFVAFARTVPHTLRNPLFHWTHLELKRYFGIDELLNEETAPVIWEQTKEQLASPEFSARALLKKFDVRALCTTDDPADDLTHHRAVADSGFEVGVYPTFRPDQAFHVDKPEIFNAWIDRLGEAANTEIASYANLLDALKSRHDFFHSVGGRLSDHGMPHCFAEFCSEAEAATIFSKVRAGTAANPEEQRKFAANIMLFSGQLDAEKGWTKQLHLGPMRNNNRRLFKQFGGDLGCDSMGDWRQAEELSAYLGRLDEDGCLPKIVIYNNNPRDNYTFASMIGNFFDGETPSKVQFGSGWWFLDQKEGMEMQLNALSNCALLSRFIGMLTDSRSFMSFPRHEYFRRTLCNLVGKDVDAGLVPDDDTLLEPMISNICYGNAQKFLGLEKS